MSQTLALPEIPPYCRARLPGEPGPRPGPAATAAGMITLPCPAAAGACRCAFGDSGWSLARAAKSRASAAGQVTQFGLAG